MSTPDFEGKLQGGGGTGLMVGKIADGSGREAALIGMVFLVVAFATRLATFGHPDLYVDEAFYFAAGVEMRHGAIPFVDIWDRKPVGHFLLYAAIARISTAIVAYQIAATIFAAATAWAIWWAARSSGNRLGAALCGIIYLLAICVFNGHGGQSAVFYNAFVAVAGAILLRQLARPRAEALHSSAIALAMALAGIALTIKTTVIFEALFMGTAALLAVGFADRRRALRMGLLWAAIGALPSVAIAVWYWSNGYWDEFWTAMVTSNLSKPAEAGGAMERLALLAAIVSPLALVGLAGITRWPKPGRYFLIGWLAAALVGFFSVPAFFLHYALPLLVPLCIAAAPFFDRRPVGIVAFAVLTALALMAFPYFDFARTERARTAMNELVDAVEETKGPGPLLVYDGPPLLYTLAGEHFPTPLAFPNHLHQLAERDVSHLSTERELGKVLARNPGAVVIKSTPPTNTETYRMVTAYIRSHCSKVASVSFSADAEQRVELYGRCGRP